MRACTRLFAPGALLLSLLVSSDLCPTARAQALSSVQVNASTGCAATCRTAFPSPNSAGNLIIVAATWGSGQSVSSISDTQGNTYKVGTGLTTGPNSFAKAQVWYAENVKAGANTVSVVLNASSPFFDVYVHEFSGVATANSLDASKSNIGTSTALDSGTLATTTAGLLFSFGVVGDGIPTATSGFTSLILADGNRTAAKVTTAAGSYNATFSNTANVDWIAQLAAFKSSGPPDTTPPTAPSNLMATAVSNMQINLSWTASTDNVGVTGYFVERCQGAGCSNFAQVATPTGTTYNDTGLAASTSYSYRVRATDAAGNLSAYSNTANATTNVAPPPPLGLMAAYSFNEGTGTTVADASGNSNTGTITGATWTAQGKFGNALVFNGTNSWVTVNDSSSLHMTTGMTLEAWVFPTAPPSGWQDIVYKEMDIYFLEATSDRGGAPAGGSIAAAGFDIIAYGPSPLPANSWSHIAVTADGATIRLYVNGAQVSTASQTAALTSSTKPLRIGGDSIYGQFFNGRIDEVRVYNRALSATEIQTDMNTAIGSTPPDTTPPTAPSNLTPTVVSGTQINLAWTVSTDPDSPVSNYFVERCQGAGCSNFVQVGAPTTNSYNDTGLAASTSYSYRVRAADAAGNLSTYSNTASTITQTLDTTPPTAPSNLTPTVVSGTQINLAWTASTDPDSPVSSYFVERCQGAGCSNFAQVGAPTTNSYNDTGLHDATTYSYRVRATDAAGNLSNYSSAATAVTPDITPPSAPSSLGATAASNSQINLTWTGSTDNVGVTGYLVERCQGAGCSSFAQVGTATGIAYSDTGLQVATTYSYRVRATDAANNLSPYSNTASATTAADTTPPTAPTNLTATVISSSQINLSWTASTDNVGVTGYFVERCKGAGCSNFAQVATPAGNSYTDSGLLASTTYSYRVRATDAAGNLSGYSNTATATTNGGSSPPPGLVAAYSFDEGTGTTVADASGNSNTGTITGATWTTQGKFGNALVFNGTNSLVTIGDSASLRLSTGMTLEAWVNPTAPLSGWTDIIYKAVDTYFLFASSTLGVPAGGATFSSLSPIYAPSPVPRNTWTHLAVTYDSAMLRLYINGVLATSQAHTTSIAASTNPLTIGGDATFGQYFTGQIDEVRVYNRALSQAELQFDMFTPINSSVVVPPPAAPSNLTARTGAPPPSIVASQAYINRTSLSVHTTDPIDSTGGNLLVVCASSHNGVTMTLSDTFNNTWVSVAGPTSTTAGVDLRSQLWYAKTPVVGGGHQFTVSPSPAQPMVISVLVIQGANLNTPLEVTSAIGDDGNTQTQNVTTPSITTAIANDLLVSFAKSSVSEVWTAESGYTQLLPASTDYMVAETQVAFTPGIYRGSWLINTPATWQSVVSAVSPMPVSGAQINLAWTNNANNASAFKVERSTDGTTFTQIATTLGTATSYSDTGLVPQTTYYYRVRATNSGGDSNYSNIASATATVGN